MKLEAGSNPVSTASMLGDTMLAAEPMPPKSRAKRHREASTDASAVSHNQREKRRLSLIRESFSQLRTELVRHGMLLTPSEQLSKKKLLERTLELLRKAPTPRLMQQGVPTAAGSDGLEDGVVLRSEKRAVGPDFSFEDMFMWGSVPQAVATFDGRLVGANNLFATLLGVDLSVLTPTHPSGVSMLQLTAQSSIASSFAAIGQLASGTLATVTITKSCVTREGAEIKRTCAKPHTQHIAHACAQPLPSTPLISSPTVRADRASPPLSAPRAVRVQMTAYSQNHAERPTHLVCTILPCE